MVILDRGLRTRKPKSQTTGAHNRAPLEPDRKKILHYPDPMGAIRGLRSMTLFH
jgi:hypothetical protein